MDFFMKNQPFGRDVIGITGENDLTYRFFYDMSPPVNFA
jgi:hypothetical protein